MATFGAGYLAYSSGSTNTPSGTLFTTAADEWAILNFGFSNGTAINITVGGGAVFSKFTASATQPQVEHLNIGPSTSVSASISGGSTCPISWVIFKNSSG